MADLPVDRVRLGFMGENLFGPCGCSGERLFRSDFAHSCSFDPHHLDVGDAEKSENGAKIWLRKIECLHRPKEKPKQDRDS